MYNNPIGGGGDHPTFSQSMSESKLDMFGNRFGEVTHLMYKQDDYDSGRKELGLDRKRTAQIKRPGIPL